MECEMDVRDATTFMYQSDDNDVVQALTSGTITLCNPTKDRMYVSNVTTEYFALPLHPLVSLTWAHSTGRTWIPYPDVTWNTNGTQVGNWHKSLSIESASRPSSLSSIPLRFGKRHSTVAFIRTCRNTIRATVDDSGETKCICWEYANFPLPAKPINLYSDIVADLQLCQVEGLSEGFQCLVFLYWDDPKTFMRITSS